MAIGVGPDISRTLNRLKEWHLALFIYFSYKLLVNTHKIPNVIFFKIKKKLKRDHLCTTYNFRLFHEGHEHNNFHP